MQMQPVMAAYASPGQITTDIIQQYLDENKQLILAILDNQHSGRADECSENQAKLQRNLMYLAAIADSQPQSPTVAQYPPAATAAQSGSRYLSHQQAQQMTPQSLMAARSSMLYAQSALQQQQQAVLHSQLAMSSGFNMVHGGNSSSRLTSGIFSGFSLGNGAGKQGMDSALQSEGRGGNSSGHSGDGMYLKGTEEEGN